MDNICGKTNCELPRAKSQFWCSEHSREYQREYRSRPEFAEKERIRTRNAQRRLRKDAVRAYGGKCICCEETRSEFLAIDHIDKKGKLGIRDSGSNLYWRLKREGWPDGFQILCHNCNLALGFYGYCPHGGING